MEYIIILEDNNTGCVEFTFNTLDQAISFLTTALNSSDCFCKIFHQKKERK